MRLEHLLRSLIPLMLALSPLLMASSVNEASFIPDDATHLQRWTAVQPKRLTAQPASVHQVLKLEPLDGPAPALKRSPLDGAPTDHPIVPFNALRIGTGYRVADGQTLALDSLAWSALADGSSIAVAELSVPSSKGLRLAVSPQSLPVGVELRVTAANGLGPVFGPFSRAQINADRLGVISPEANAPYWLPAVGGDTVRLELATAANVNLHGTALSITSVSVLIDAPRESAAKDLSDVGSSGACNIDISCSDSPLSPTVAKYLFTDGQGSTFLCTGGLLNDTGNTGTPWFITAAHCVDSGSEASTMQFYWNFRSSSCGGGPITPLSETFGGATLLSTSEVYDTSFMRLNQAPPTSARAGWNGQEVTQVQNVTGIHHPSGDLQKISFGQLIAYTGIIDPAVDDSHFVIEWQNGVTEPGSSGSGIFNTSNQLLGVLTGGFSSCDVPDGQDFYGRFDKMFATLDDWLVTTGNGGGSLEPGTIVTFAGQVTNTEGTPLCAMVLINGEFMFSCDGNGQYQLSFPLDSSAQATVFAFVDGLAPFRQVVTPGSTSQTQNIVVSPSSDPTTATVNLGTVTDAGGGWVNLSGTVTNTSGTPLCGVVLANGQYTFSCGSAGAFALTVPREANGSVTLFVFVDGLSPYRNTFTP